MTTQLWIKGTRCLVRADTVTAITLERQEDPVMHLVRLETTDSQFLLGGWDNKDFDEVWPTVDALVAMLARCNQRNESGVVTLSSSGKVVFVESDKWAAYRGEDEPIART